jgi:hypothetical protein
MKSKGRVSLELRCRQTSVAQPALEDGDTILVPTLPAFVAAAGSVNNDNVFIYRQGKTVGDVIDLCRCERRLRTFTSLCVARRWLHI